MRGESPTPVAFQRRADRRQHPDTRPGRQAAERAVPDAARQHGEGQRARACAKRKGKLYLDGGRAPDLFVVFPAVMADQGRLLGDRRNPGRPGGQGLLRTTAEWGRSRG